MNTYRRHAVVAGILLVIATVAAIAGGALYRPYLGDPLDLPKIATNTTPIFIGSLIQLIGYAACPAIALAMYPLLRRYNEALAVGSVVFRSIEAVFYSLGVVGLLMLVAVSHDAAQPGVADANQFQHTAAVLGAARDVVGSVTGVAFFACGGLLYYLVLFQFALVPRWLSGWGLIAAALSLVSAVLVLTQMVAPMSTSHVFLNLPVAVQEMVLAVWLIAKGFDQRATLSAPMPGGSLAGAAAG